MGKFETASSAPRKKDKELKSNPSKDIEDLSESCRNRFADSWKDSVPRNPSETFNTGTVLVFPAGTVLWPERNYGSGEITSEQPTELQVESRDYESIRFKNPHDDNIYAIRKENIPAALPTRFETRLNLQDTVKDEMSNILKNRFDEDTNIPVKGLIWNLYLRFDFQNREVSLYTSFPKKDKRDTENAYYGKNQCDKLASIGTFNESKQLARDTEDPFMQTLSSESAEALYAEAIHRQPSMMADARYERRSERLRTLITIEEKVGKGDDAVLTREELKLLCDIENEIPGIRFDDQRIVDILSTRNAKEDAPLALGYAPEQIAWSKDSVSENTKVYIGELFEDIFTLPDLEHIYISFPERKIERMIQSIGGKTGKQLVREIENKDIYVDPAARSELSNDSFPTLDDKEQIEYVRLEAGDLINAPNSMTTQEIVAQAEKFGLEFCPREFAAHLRLDRNLDYTIVMTDETTNMFTLGNWPRSLEIRTDIEPQKDWSEAKVKFAFRCNRATKKA